MRAIAPDEMPLGVPSSSASSSSSSSSSSSPTAASGLTSAVWEAGAGVSVATAAVDEPADEISFSGSVIVSFCVLQKSEYKQKKETIEFVRFQEIVALLWLLRLLVFLLARCIVFLFLFFLLVCVFVFFLIVLLLLLVVFLFFLLIGIAALPVTSRCLMRLKYSLGNLYEVLKKLTNKKRKKIVALPRSLLIPFQTLLDLRE